MAESRRLSILGSLGLAVRDAPTVRQMVELLVQHVGLHNEALHYRIEENGGLVTIRQDVVLKGRGSMRQSVELSLGALFRILRIYLGEDWSPRRVCFVHPSPVDIKVHRRFFGPNLEFSCEFDGVVCKSSDLDTPIASADPIMATYARKALDASPGDAHSSIASDIRQLVLILLPTGRCTVDLVAKHLNVDRRTVHRQLSKDRLTFSDIVTSVRADLSDRYLQDSKRTLTEIAILLGFSGASAFSRWHQSHFATTPLARRRALQMRTLTATSPAPHQTA